MFGQEFDSPHLHLTRQTGFLPFCLVFYFAVTRAQTVYQLNGVVQSVSSKIFTVKSELFWINRTNDNSFMPRINVLIYLVNSIIRSRCHVDIFS
jgi:hypothetical protein